MIQYVPTVYAQEQYGGRFTSYEHFCCDGTIVLDHEAVESGFPDGSFKTSWSMDAYRELFYFPTPGTCSLGFVRSGGSCTTVSSFCEDTEFVDYTITMIGTSMPGCQFASGGSDTGGGNGGGDDNGIPGDGNGGGDDNGIPGDNGDGGDGGDGDGDEADGGGDGDDGATDGVVRLAQDTIEIIEGRGFDLALLGTGGDGGPYSIDVLDALPAGVRVIQEEGGKHVEGSIDTEGEYLVDVEITDGSGNSDTDTLTIDVKDLKVSCTAPDSISLGGGHSVTVTIDAETNGDQLGGVTYTWSGGGSPESETDTGGSFDSFTTKFSSTSTYDITVEAEDSRDQRDLASCSIDVEE